MLRKTAKTDLPEESWEEYVRDTSRNPKKEQPIILNPFCGKAYYRHIKYLWKTIK